MGLYVIVQEAQIGSLIITTYNVLNVLIISRFRKVLNGWATPHHFKTTKDGMTKMLLFLIYYFFCTLMLILI